MEKRNGVKLSAFLLRYMLLCAVSSITLLLFFWMALMVATNSGFVLPANEGERQAKQACEALEQAGSFDAALVPELCGYALFDAQGAVVQASLSGAALEDAQHYRETGQNSGKRFHKSADLQSGVCVLQYTFEMAYTNPALRGRLPEFQVLHFTLMLASLLFVLGGITLYTARRMRRSLQPLTDATNEMVRGNLAWRAASTGIAEYDDVLYAMQKLQTALGESLQAQWSMEHSRVAQMQALAHDLRTPLTVIDGNAQLLEETPLTPEQAECVNAIARAGGAAQDYVLSLRRIAGADKPPAAQPTDAEQTPSDAPSAQKPDTVDTAVFLRGLTQEAREICKVHGRQLASCAQAADIYVGLPPTLVLHTQEVRRAVGNLVQNAAEHSPQGGSVALAFSWVVPMLTVTVEDSGPGFSPQALAHATQPLFTEHKGRTPEGHLGLGLAMAQQTALRHGGTVSLANTPDGHGCVCFTLCMPQPL